MNQAEWEASVEWVGIVAGCVIEKDGKYLLVQEKQQKVYGLWNLPAGYVDKGESFEQAAIREAHAATGLSVEIIREIGVYHEAVGKPVKHAFLAALIGGELRLPEGEILDAQWYTIEQITKLKEDNKLRAEWIYAAISAVR